MDGRTEPIWMPEQALIDTVRRKAARWPIHAYSTGGGIVVYNGLVLLLQRLRRGEVRLPKGHIEPGETVADCAIREVREETGLQAPILVLPLGIVENRFAHRGSRFVRHEEWFLMTAAAMALGTYEPQWQPVWVPLAEATGLLTYESERVPMAWGVEAVAQGALGK
jgi:8-oxo-dGTP pyrophosphatase MutT (NUDIX family)